MKTRDVMIICATLIILIVLGLFIAANSADKESTILTMTSSPSLNEGDSIILKLNDENGSAIESQRIEINLTDDDGICENFTLKTNSKGECRLEDIIAGNFTLISKYYGNSHYKPSSISGNISVKKASESSTENEFKLDYKADEVINGWDPKEHEVSREPLGDGTVRINYDDGYFRIVDSDGNILTYGY